MREKYSYVCKFVFDLSLGFCLIQTPFRFNPQLGLGSFCPQPWNPTSPGPEGPKPEESGAGIKHLSEGKKDALIQLRFFCSREFSFPILWLMSVSQGALRYPACFDRGARKNGFSRMMAWGILWMKPRLSHVLVLLQGSRMCESRNPRIPAI